MQAIVESIPNFSEGRNEKLLQKLAEQAQCVPGAALLNHSADADHNRSVYTLAGSPEAVGEAVFNMCRTAAESIDLAAHAGVHPRMGAIDVIPFVPLRGMEMEAAVQLSRRVGRRIGRELGVPVFLYEESATAPHRRNLAQVRRGGFEALAQKMTLAEWQPDYGPPAPHPTAGAVAVGARRPLIAFNVNLATGDVAVASAIAKTIRGSSGGFAACKAIGLELKGQGTTQVSMNLVDYTTTSLFEVMEAIRAEAARHGVVVAGSELIGLVPAAALFDCAASYLQLEGFDSQKQVLEQALEEKLGFE